MAAQLESILTQRDLTKEQRKAMLVNVDEKKLVLEPEVLDPVLSAYQKSIDLLKYENNSLRNDLVNLTDSLDLLLKDNRTLREFNEKKSQDLHSMIQTVSENEGELVQSLRANLELASEENRVLVYENSMLKKLRQEDKGGLDFKDRNQQEGELFLYRQTHHQETAGGSLRLKSANSVFGEPEQDFGRQNQKLDPRTGKRPH